jgi:Tfp pilus assembly protein PilN
MIEINLLPGRKVAKAGFSFGKLNFRSALANLRSNVRDPWLAAATGAWVLLLGGGGGLFLITRTQLARVEGRLETVRAEKRRFDVVIALKRQAERMRDSLARELSVIQAIDADRYVWPHVLDQVAKALPPYTWLTDIGTTAPQPVVGSPTPAPPTGDTLGAPPVAVQVAITGRTVDIQAYTTFLRQLAQSPWFTDVTPQQSTTVIEADRPVTAFNVTLRYRQADSVYLKTVPLIQSVR